MNETRVFYMSLSEAEKIPAADCEALFPQRMLKARRYVNHGDYLRSVAAGALTRYALGLPEGDIATGPQGKPYPLKGELRFSLSHSGDYAMLAIAPYEVGVDIEKLAPCSLGVAKRVFTADELLWLNLAHGEEEGIQSFHTLWTLKESVLKLDGRGFALSPSAFSVMPALRGSPLCLDFGTVYTLTGTLFNCAYALASFGPLPPAIAVSPVPLTAEAFLSALPCHL